MRISDWSSDVCSSDLGLGRNIGAFTLQDLLPHADADGRVTITVGPEENGSGPLHLRTEPGRIKIYTRDSQSDWAQVPAEVSVRRLDPPVDWRSRPEDEIAEIGRAHVRTPVTNAHLDC